MKSVWRLGTGNCENKDERRVTKMLRSIVSKAAWRHPQNRNSITFCSVVGERPSHGKISSNLDVWVLRFTQADRQIYMHTCIHTYRHADKF